MDAKPPVKENSNSRFSSNLFIAFIVVLGLIGMAVLFAGPALFALGVFNPSTYTAKAATGFSELGLPEDWQYHNTTLTIVLKNQAAQAINLIRVESPSCTAYSGQQTISSGGTYQVSLTGCPAKSPGSAYSQSVTITYSSPSGLTKRVAGTLTGTAA